VHNFFCTAKAVVLPKENARQNKKYAATFLGAQADASKVSTAKKCPFHRHFFEVMSFEKKTASNKRYFCVE